MLIVQLGSSLACSKTALLLQRFGAQVYRFAAPRSSGMKAAVLLEEALDFGKQGVSSPVDSLSAGAIDSILEKADLVIDDHSFAYWLERGVHVKRLYESNPPHAHWLGITPYGLVGAGDSAAGTELTYQASGPLMARTGEAGRPPLPMKGPQASFGAAWHAALVGAAAEFGRTGRGSLIDVSIQECQFMHSDHGAANWYLAGVEMSRMPAVRRTNSTMHPTLDGKVFMLYHDREWPRVARMIGREDLAQDSRFMTRYERANHMDELEALVTPWFMERTRVEAVEAGQAAGMPVAMAETPANVLDDPQLAFRGAFETIPLDNKRIRFPVGAGWFPGHDFPAKRSANDKKPDESLDAFLEELRAKAQGLHPEPVEGRNGADGGSADPTKPLKGVRVIDLTNTLAAPRAATLLGSLGAEVIKLEGLEWMDMLRGYTTPPDGHTGYPYGIPGKEPWNRWLQWLGLGRNKLSAGVELTKPEGKAILEELVAISDVVMTNMSKSTRAKYDLDYEHLRQINPEIIFATLTAYGDEGPRSEWRLFGDGQSSMSGLFFGTGYEGEESLGIGVFGDPVNGTALAFQIVEGLLLRRNNGRGTHVDVSAVETCLTYNARAYIEAQTGEDAGASVGSDALGRWPHGSFRCAGEDRWIAISCGSDAQRQGLIEGLQAAGINCDVPAAQAIRDGTASEEQWREFLDAACADRDPGTLEKVLQRRGVPAQHVMRARDNLEDPVLSSRGFVNWLWRDDLGTYPVYAAFWLINNQRPAITHAPPLLGEDNDYVFRQLLGKSADEVAELERKGVVGDTPLVGAELGIRPSERVT